MGLESTAQFINDLVSTNPDGATDYVYEGDDHIRLIKAVLKRSFAGFPGAVIVYGEDTANTNNYAINPATAVSAYNDGMVVVLTVANANTGASTLNVSGLGAKPIQQVSGTDISAGDLQANVPAVLVYKSGVFVYPFSRKADKKVPSAANNIAVLDSTGNLADGGATVDINATPGTVVKRGAGGEAYFEDSVNVRPNASGTSVFRLTDSSGTAVGSLIADSSNDIILRKLVSGVVVKDLKLTSSDALVSGNKVWHDGDAAKSLSYPGYHKFPSGLIIQWGEAVTGSGGNVVVTFPIAFPTAVLCLLATDVGSGAPAFGCEYMSLSQFKLWARWHDGNYTAGVTGRWFALGF